MFRSWYLRAKRALDLGAARRTAPTPNPRLGASYFGKHFKHPVGIELTTDLDIEYWAARGFAFVEVTANVAHRLPYNVRPIPVGLSYNTNGLYGVDVSLLHDAWISAEPTLRNRFALRRAKTARVARISAEWTRQPNFEEQLNRACDRPWAGIRLASLPPDEARQAISRVFHKTGGLVPIISSGVVSGEDASARIEAGASLLVIDAASYVAQGSNLLQVTVDGVRQLILRQGAPGVKVLIGQSA